MGSGVWYTRTLNDDRRTSDYIDKVQSRKAPFLELTSRSGVILNTGIEKEALTILAWFLYPELFGD